MQPNEQRQGYAVSQYMHIGIIGSLENELAFMPEVQQNLVNTEDRPRDLVFLTQSLLHHSLPGREKLRHCATAWSTAKLTHKF